MNKRTDILERKEEILEWIRESQSKAFICKQLSCRPGTLDNALNEMNILYSGNKGGKGIKKAPNRMSALEYLKKDCVQSSKLRKKLIEDNVFEHKCVCCGYTMWKDKPIPLELNHIDGNHYNNELENLELLCPNCHAQTDTYRGKNIGSYT